MLFGSTVETAFFRIKLVGSRFAFEYKTVVEE